MTLYICMSLAGSIPIIMCFLLWVVQRQAYNFRLGKKFLLTGMAFYLMPFQVIKFKLPERMDSVVSLPIDLTVEQKFCQVISIKNIMSPEESIWIPVWVTVLMFVWLWCIIIFAVYQVVRYRLDIRKLLSKAVKVSVDVNGKAAELLVVKNIPSPYTVGFIKPVIIVPEDCLESPCFSMIYRHEEQHRKNYDSLMKLICIVIICIHWINPVAILLLFLYDITAEYVCDAHAGEGCTDEEKKRYLKLLVKISTEDEPLSMVWRNHLSGSEKLMKRRINYMMKKSKAGFFRKGIAAAVSVVTVFASASTILAYEPLLSTNENDIEVFSEESFISFSDEDSIGSYDFSKSDSIFVYEDGTQVAITNEASPYAWCNHNLVSGYISTHKANGSGGCTVKVYTGKRCSRCGYIELGSLSSTHTYTVCPH